MTAEADLVRLGEAVEKSRALYALEMKSWMQMREGSPGPHGPEHAMALALLAHVGGERMVLTKDGEYGPWDESDLRFDETVAFHSSGELNVPAVAVVEVVVVRRTRIGEGT